MSTPPPEDSIPSTIPSTPSDPDKVLIDAPGENNAPLQPPTPFNNLTPLGTSLRDSLTPSAAPFRDSFAPSGALLVPETEKGLEENVADEPESRRSLFRRPIFWFAVVAGVVVVVLAVILPVYFTVIKPKNDASSDGSGNSNGGNGGNGSGNNNPTTNLATTGGDGSTVTTDNGTEFTYHNPFGGFCMWSPPFP